MTSLPDRQWGRHCLPACATLLLAAVAAADPAPPQGVRIAAHASHYVMGDRRFDDLDALEEAVRRTRPARVHLDACGPRASWPMMAAAQRLRDTALHLHVLDAEDPGCAGGGTDAVRVGAARTPRGIDDIAVARYWMAVMP